MADARVDRKDLAQVRIHRPHGCDRKRLSIDALDRITRELAYGTTIEIGGKLLLCKSFHVRESDGDELLVLEIAPECYQFLEKPKEPKP
jgi:hypothetical protein